MSSQKIIFIAIIGLLTVGFIFGIWNLSQKGAKDKIWKVNTLSVWVVWDTSEQYDTLFSKFWEYAKEYAKTKIEVRVFSDYTQYQRILLSVLADGKWPDIFMVDANADDVLATKVEPIPEDIINLDTFEKKYEDIFLPLLSNTGGSGNSKKYIQWVPLGYETLWIFYNKSLLRALPKTWNEVGAMYTDGIVPNTFPTNIGMWPRYTPYATDIIAYFMAKFGMNGYDGNSGSQGLDEYLSYEDSPLISSSPDTVTLEISGPNTLKGLKSEMDDKKLTTIDLFMRWRIAFVVWYPSLIHEIEKAQKRAGNDAVDALILTEKLPQDSLSKDHINIARYSYLGISKKTENPIAWAKLLAYLMTEDVQSKVQDIFPLLISPVRALSVNTKNTSLSQIFARTRMDAFIPESTDKLTVFHYGIKSEFERIFSEEIDRNGKIDINNLITQITTIIKCELESIKSDTLSKSCEKSE